jgi:hypothetical protein
MEMKLRRNEKEIFFNSRSASAACIVWQPATKSGIKIKMKNTNEKKRFFHLVNFNEIKSPGLYENIIIYARDLT